MLLTMRNEEWQWRKCAVTRLERGWNLKAILMTVYSGVSGTKGHGNSRWDIKRRCAEFILVLWHTFHGSMHSICRGDMLVACALSNVEQYWALAFFCLVSECSLIARRIRQRLHKKLGTVLSKKDFASAMERFKLLEQLGLAWPSLSRFGFGREANLKPT